MNKTGQLILGLVGIIIFFYVYTGKSLIEGLDNKKDGKYPTIRVKNVNNPKYVVRMPKKSSEKPPEEPKEEKTTFSPKPAKKVPVNQCEPPVMIEGKVCPPQTVVTKQKYCYNSPRYGPPKDPNSGLISTCTNLVRSHVNKCTASAANMMTRAFGPTIQSKDHQHATDSRLLGFLKRTENKLKDMVYNKRVTDKAIELAPQFMPKFEYPKRRGLTSNEYNMWKNVLTNDDVVSTSDNEGRDVNIFVSDNRTKNKQGQNKAISQNKQTLSKYPEKFDSSEPSESSGPSGPLKGAIGQGKKYVAYNHDDYL